MKNILYGYYHICLKSEDYVRRLCHFIEYIKSNCIYIYIYIQNIYIYIYIYIYILCATVGGLLSFCEEYIEFVVLFQNRKKRSHIP